MDVFTRFNRKNIQDRQIDTLIGLSTGVSAYGKVNRAEAVLLISWLVQNRRASTNPIRISLLQKISVMRGDGVLDREGPEELLRLRLKIPGDQYESVELA